MRYRNRFINCERGFGLGCRGCSEVFLSVMINFIRRFIVLLIGSRRMRGGVWWRGRSWRE
jgi:hypothetical protein